MAGYQFMKSGAFAALAVGLAVAALPASASAQDQGRHGGSESRRGGQDNGGRGDSDGRQRQQQQATPAPQVQAAPQVQRQQQPRANRGERNVVDRGDTPGRGWGSRRTEGQPYGRDWSNGGVVNRPDAASRNRAAEQARQAPQVQQRIEGQQRYQAQRSYSDAQRNGSYTPRQQSGQQGWDGQQWQGQNRDGDRYRDRDARTTQRWDGNRDGRRWDGNRTGNWSRDWRRDNRYNWQTWRSSNRDVFRLGRYYSPYSNWSYRRLGIGFSLQPLFFSQNYWIADPWMYRLPEAYGPYRWVRYYDDALLVNIYDGEVVDVIYDFFW